MSARCFDGCTAGAASFRVINNEKSCTRFSGSNLSPGVFHDVEEREGANETSEVSPSVSNAARILLNIQASFRAESDLSTLFQRKNFLVVCQEYNDATGQMNSGGMPFDFPIVKQIVS